MSTLLAVSGLLAAPVRPSAAPSIAIKGRPAVRLRAVRRQAEASLVHGELRDPAQRRGLKGRRVRMAVAVGRRLMVRSATTDEHGRFTMRLPLPAGRYRVALRFAGDRYYAPAKIPWHQLDISRSTVDLQVELAAALRLSPQRYPLQIRTAVDDQPVSLPVELRLRGKPLARAHTDRSGRAVIQLDPRKLGPPGPVALEVRARGNSTINGAHRRIETVLRSPVTLTLQAAERQIDADGRVALHGSARDHRGPLARVPISLEAMGQHVASTLTDARGRFRFDAEAVDFPPGPLELRARFRPSALWRLAARSRAVTVEVLPTRPIPTRLYAIPTLISLLTLGALFAARRLGDLRWPSLRRSRRPETEPLAATREPPLRSGARPAKKRLARRAQLAIDGEVWDSVDDCPVAGARVLLRGGDGDQTLRADRRGRFASPGDLEPGRYEVSVAAPRYVSERFAIELPHRGEYHGLRVELIQVRVRVLELYRAVALERLPGAHLWARWTPRELAGGESGDADRRPLLELTRLLEQTYWSATVPAERAVERAQSLAAELARADAD